MRPVWGVFVLGLGVLAACHGGRAGGAVRHARRPGNTRRARACVRRVPLTAHRLEPWRPPLPPVRPFVDPKPPTRRLRALRRAASRRVGARRLFDMCQLAARLWEMGRQAAELAGRQAPGSQGRRDALRMAHAHFSEAVLLLRQVVSEAPEMLLARLRLAYYLRILDPSEGVDAFMWLVDNGPAGIRRRARLDLARLLVAQGRPKTALDILDRGPSGPEACHIRFAALWQVGRFRRAAEAFECALGQPGLDGIDAAARVASVLARPWEHLAAWAGRLQVDRRRLAERTLARLTAMGRLDAAERLARRAGLSWAAPRWSAAELLAHRAAWCLMGRRRPLRVKVTAGGDGCRTEPELSEGAGACLCRALARHRLRCRWVFELVWSGGPGRPGDSGVSTAR